MPSESRWSMVRNAPAVSSPCTESDSGRSSGSPNVTVGMPGEEVGELLPTAMGRQDHAVRAQAGEGVDFPAQGFEVVDACGEEQLVVLRVQHLGGPVAELGIDLVVQVVDGHVDHAGAM